MHSRFCKTLVFQRPVGWGGSGGANAPPQFRPSNLKSWDQKNLHKKTLRFESRSNRANIQNLLLCKQFKYKLKNFWKKIFCSSKFYLLQNFKSSAHQLDSTACQRIPWDREVRHEIVSLTVKPWELEGLPILEIPNKSPLAEPFSGRDS